MNRMISRSLTCISIVFLSLFLLKCNYKSSRYPVISKIPKVDSILVTQQDLDSKKVVDVNHVFDSIAYIPLETTDSSFFSTVNQMEVTKDRMFILDWSTNSIYAFDMNGAFKFKIRAKSLMHFDIDKENIVFHDVSVNHIYRYDFNGKLLATWKKKFGYHDEFYFDDGTVAYYRRFAKKDRMQFEGSYNIVFGSEDGKILNGILPYDTTAVEFGEIPSSVKQFYRTSTGADFILPGDSKVFRISTKAPPSYLEMQLPVKYRLPKDYLVNTSLYGKRDKYLDEHPDQAYNFKNFYKVGPLTTFEWKSRNRKDVAIWDERYDKMVLGSNLGSGPRNNELMIGPTFLAADGESLYQSASARDLFNKRHFSIIAKYVDHMPPKIRHFFETGNLLSNLVIIRLFPKVNNK